MPSRSLAGALVALASTALLCLAPASRATELQVRWEGPPRLTLPVKLRYGVPAISCTLNDLPSALILDTGSQISLLSTETARRVGVRASEGPGTRMILTGSHGRETARLALVDRFATAGGWSCRQLPMVVRDRTSEPATRGGERILIDVLSGRVLRGMCSFVTFDPASGTVTLGFTDKFRPSSRDAVSTSLGFEHELPHADIRVDGVRVRCLIDTGTTAALELNPQDAAAVKLRVRSSGTQRRRIGIGESGSSASLIRSGRAAQIEIAGVQLRGAEVLSVADRSKVGFGFLKYFRTTFDFRRGRLWFEGR